MITIPVLESLNLVGVFDLGVLVFMKLNELVVPLLVVKLLVSLVTLFVILSETGDVIVMSLSNDENIVARLLEPVWVLECIVGIVLFVVLDKAVFPSEEE